MCRAQIGQLALNFFRAHPGALAQRAIGGGLGFRQTRGMGFAFLALACLCDSRLIGALALFRRGNGQALGFDQRCRGCGSFLVSASALLSHPGCFGFQSFALSGDNASPRLPMCAILSSHCRTVLLFNALHCFLYGMHGRGAGKIAVPIGEARLVWQRIFLR